MGDEDVLLTKRLAKLQAARHAIVAEIEQLIGDDRPQAMHCALVALSGLLADIISISERVLEDDAKLADVINEQLADSGWRVVPVLHY